MISLEDFLTTNRAPDDEEKREIRQFIAKYDDALTTITTKIRDLETQLQALNDEKAALLEVVAPFKRALLPFRQLPDDVIREIFMACLPAGRNPTMSNKEAPVLLTQISRATRRMSLETPALWSAIHIAILPPSSLGYMDYSPAPGLMSARAEAVEEWLLRRSGSLPLNISVYHPREPYNEQDFGQIIIDVLLSCCSRWRCVSLSDVPNRLFRRISTLIHTDVPALNSLSILSNHIDHNTIDWNSSLILTAPSLQRLSVSGMSNPSDFLANWSNLTHIGFRIPPLEITADMAIILRQTTRLISCCINISFAGGELPEPTDEIPLPFLKVLIIDDYTHSNVIGGILSSIHAPALEVIQYNASIEMFQSPANLIYLLKRTPNLQELCTGHFSNPAILAECLRHCPSLTCLRFSSFNPYYDDDVSTKNNDAFIEAFVPDNVTQSCLCPRLEYFQCDSAMSLSLGTLHKFIEYVKNKPNQSLGHQNTVVMKIKYHPEDEHQHYIDELTSKDVIGDMKLSLLFEKQAAASNPIYAGVKALETPEDDWWQRRSMSTLDI